MGIWQYVQKQYGKEIHNSICMCTWAVASLVCVTYIWDMLSLCCYSRVKIKACCCLYIERKPNWRRGCVCASVQENNRKSEFHKLIMSSPQAPAPWWQSKRHEKWEECEASTGTGEKGKKRVKEAALPSSRVWWQRQMEVDILCASHLQYSVTLSLFVLCFRSASHFHPSLSYWDKGPFIPWSLFL